ncbi:hypothetical protein [Loktanella sp. SALINAS62]|uniref:hypothetical protein n=1 Tax=Loktanella sp. SALINAS62 TaxID=2706124 RepID=UPI001B8B472C|nr:hypothetical protein [Loktanella sp. SALINAS62]MBS1303338.1 hypothetical protein [Loktanella sp. SALINAS62]
MERRYFQDWLDGVIDHAHANDGAGWADRFARPTLIVSHDRRSLIETDAEFAAKFSAWRGLFRVYRVTHMLRTVTDLQPDGDARVIGTYDTDILADGKRVMPRFRSTKVLVRQGDIWRCCQLTTGMGAADGYLFHTEHDGTRAPGSPQPSPTVERTKP